MQKTIKFMPHVEVIHSSVDNGQLFIFSGSQISVFSPYLFIIFADFYCIFAEPDPIQRNFDRILLVEVEPTPATKGKERGGSFLHFQKCIFTSTDGFVGDGRGGTFLNFRKCIFTITSTVGFLGKGKGGKPF